MEGSMPRPVQKARPAALSSWYATIVSPMRWTTSLTWMNRWTIHAIRVAPRTFIDVAVPRDVDPRVSELSDVRVFDLDDLQRVSAANLERREEAAGEGGEIVRRATVAYEEWLQRRRAAPTIKAIVEQAATVRRAEVARTARDLRLDAAGHDKLDRMSAAIIKKLLHEPILYLRDADETESAAELLRRVFGVRDD